MFSEFQTIPCAVKAVGIQTAIFWKV